VRLTPDEIRALGGVWPLDSDVADLVVERGGAIDLDATLANLESAARYVQRELDDMSRFARQWNASYGDFTDNRDRYGSRRIACTEAIAQLRAVRGRARMPGAWLRRMRARLAALVR